MPYHAIIRTGYRTWVGKEVRWRLGVKSTACRSRSSRVSCPCLSPCWKFSWRCRVGCMKVPGLHNYKRPRVDHSHMLGSCCSHTASCPTNNIVKHQWTGLLSPPYLSPCDCRMFCHRHKLRRGHRSQTPELRSCRMLAGSSIYYYIVIRSVTVVRWETNLDWSSVAVHWARVTYWGTFWSNK